MVDFTPIPVAALDQWVAKILPWWIAHREGVDPANGLTQDNRLLNTYYDAQRCFLNLRDFRPVGERAYWEAAALDARLAYRDLYVIANGFHIQSHWIYARGLFEDWSRFANLTSKNAVISLSQLTAYAPDAAPLAETITTPYSRDTAYALMDYILAERLGEPRRAKYLAYKDQIFGHMHEWFIAQNAPFFRPFMFALSAYTLIEFAVDNPSFKQEIIDILTIGADWTDTHMWDPVLKSWKYTNVILDGGVQDVLPAPDLNLLISPIWAWLYYQTGQDRFRARFDDALEGAIPIYHPTDLYWISGAYLGSRPTAAGVLGKHVNQNTRNIFEGLFWRQQVPLPLQSPTGGSTGGTGSGGTTGSGGGTDPGGSATDPIPAGVRSIILPIKYETFENHFITRGWASPQDQVDAGYAIYIQPGNVSAIFEETIDLEAVIPDGTLISVFYTPEKVAGTVNIATSISVSVNNVAFRDYFNQENVFESNFRFVRIRMVATATDQHGILRIPEIRLKIAAKEKRDGGSASVTDATNGKVITFNKHFADIDSITVTPENVDGLGYGVGGYYIFTDVANPTQFTVILKRQDTGANVTGRFSWAAKGT